MRTLETARPDWQVLQDIPDVEGFRARLHKQHDDTGDLSSRSIFWKTLLLFESADKSVWLRRLGDSRSAYVSLRSHLLRAIDHPDEVDTGEDPLSEQSRQHWETLRQDEALRQEILQDVHRCMPENTYFRQTSPQSMMLDALFIYCKLNPDVSYRQGMHEILAPILWVVQCDAIEDSSKEESDFLISQVCDSRFIEHDSFTLFSLVMQSAKRFYEQKAHDRSGPYGSSRTSAKLENPINSIVTRIFEDVLPRLDSELATHLRNIDLLPQVFLIRWIRLLFGREFLFDETLAVWDVLFARDPHLESTEMICILMLLRLRWELLESDHNEALSLLLRYPSLTNDLQPHNFVTDAQALRATPTSQKAAELILKYTGRRVTTTEEALPDPDAFALNDDDPSMITTQRSPRNFEAIFQDAAKNVLTQSERWGLNKAFRDAVDEVKRGVKDIQSIPTPTAPRMRHARLQSRSSISSPSTRRPDLELKLARQQARNEQLASMLKTATDQLWECQRVLSDQHGADAEQAKQLGMSIARVGFVQVYLEDPSIPLAQDDTVQSTKLAEADGEAILLSPTVSRQETNTSTRPGISANTAVPTLQLPYAPPPTSQTNADQPAAPVSGTSSGAVAAPTSPARPVTPFNPHTSRPSLSQSSFSWMLGQSAPEDPSLNGNMSRGASPFVVSAASSASRPRSRGFLFGDDEEGNGDEDVGGGGTKGLLGTPTRKKGTGRERKVVRRSGRGGGSSIDHGQADDGFDLSDLKSG